MFPSNLTSFFKEVKKRKGKRQNANANANAKGHEAFSPFEGSPGPCERTSGFAYHHVLSSILIPVP
jgi:hypothetical protein